MILPVTLAMDNHWTKFELYSSFRSWLISPNATLVDGCISDGDPGIRLQSAGLLQLGTQRHHREPFPTPAVGAERSSQADHTDRTAWAHYACLTTTSLAACSTPCGIQAGRSRVQGSTRSRTAVPLRRLSVGGESRSTSEISWCTDMCCTADQDPVWWQEFCCGWSAGLE